MTTVESDLSDICSEGGQEYVNVLQQTIKQYKPTLQKTEMYVMAELETEMGERTGRLPR